MDFLETEEQQLLRRSVAKLAAGYGHRYFIDQVRSGGRCEELWQACGELGFLGVNLPEAHGGGGQGIAELAIVQEELAAAGCPIIMVFISPGITGPLISRFGNDDQQARWLPGIASGRSKMAFAITEPDAGSNSYRTTTTATRDGDEFRLTGRKQFTSGFDEADHVLVIARTGTDGRGRSELSMFVVPTDAPGVRADPIPMETALAETQFNVFFDEVRVPATDLVGEEGGGLGQVFHGLNPERILVGALALGIARYALEKATAYARERQVWDAPIGAHQGIAHPLAEAKVHTELAALVLQKAAWLHDRGDDAAEAANMGKYAAAEAAIESLDQAIQTHGGNGMATEYGIATLWSLTRVLRLGPVSREMILNFVAQHSLGLPRSY